MSEREKVIQWLEASLMLSDDVIEKGTLPNNVILDAKQYFADALALLNDPDRVRVVRCSDCRYWEPPTDIEADDGSTMGHCRNDYAPCQNQQVDMNWFCADGERGE